MTQNWKSYAHLAWKLEDWERLLLLLTYDKLG